MTTLLVINPGSTSTKVALFREEQMVWAENLRHDERELARFPTIHSQLQCRAPAFRLAAIRDLAAQKGLDLSSLDAVVARGGMLRPIPGGTYAVNEPMLQDLADNVGGEHSSNLGAWLGHDIADRLGIPVFIVDPVAVDEFEPLARISGLPELPRRSLGHMLNIKAIARRAAGDLGKTHDTVRLVVAHLGSGISVCAYRDGRIIDINNANAEGPFSPERAGGLPSAEVIRICFSGKYSEQQIKDKVLRNGGLKAYLGTGDAREIEARIEAGDEKASLVFEAMAYQIAREIGAMSTVLKGALDAIVLTGGLAHSRWLVDEVRRRVAFLGLVMVYPGEDELEALVDGALRVLRGEEPAREYRPV
ncbi:MAG: butyrate kinase [Firmicutes bacterium]|nr:butyrate kinase [Bacillota bacterium]